jgi:hypothetical protein
MQVEAIGRAVRRVVRLGIAEAIIRHDTVPPAWGPLLLPGIPQPTDEPIDIQVTTTLIAGTAASPIRVDGVVQVVASEE